MKLHICVNEAPLAGYVNVDAAKVQVDLGNMDMIAEPAECTEIIVNDVLKFMPHGRILEVIQHLASRLRHGGKITFIFTDVNSIIREYNRGAINEQTLNELLYNGSRSCCSCDYIKQIIQDVHLKIKEIQISVEQVIMVAERP